MHTYRHTYICVQSVAILALWTTRSCAPPPLIIGIICSALIMGKSYPLPKRGGASFEGEANIHCKRLTDPAWSKKNY